MLINVCMYTYRMYISMCLLSGLTVSIRHHIQLYSLQMYTDVHQRMNNRYCYYYYYTVYKLKLVHCLLTRIVFYHNK